MQCSLVTKAEPRGKTETIFRRDISRLAACDLEDVLQSIDWSLLYSIEDPNEAVEFLLNHVKEALDLVAPLKATKFRPDKPKISLKHDTLATMASRDIAQFTSNFDRYKVHRNKTIKLIQHDRIQKPN